jgi:hypothetical protein
LEYSNVDRKFSHCKIHDDESVFSEYAPPVAKKRCVLNKDYDGNPFKQTGSRSLCRATGYRFTEGYKICINHNVDTEGECNAKALDVKKENAVFFKSPRDVTFLTDELNSKQVCVRRDLKDRESCRAQIKNFIDSNKETDSTDALYKKSAGTESWTYTHMVVGRACDGNNYFPFRGGLYYTDDDFSSGGTFKRGRKGCTCPEPDIWRNNDYINDTNWNLDWDVSGGVPLIDKCRADLNVEMHFIPNPDRYEEPICMVTPNEAGECPGDSGDFKLTDLTASEDSGKFMQKISDFTIPAGCRVIVAENDVCPDTFNHAEITRRPTCSNSEGARFYKDWDRETQKSCEQNNFKYDDSGRKCQIVPFNKKIDENAFYKSNDMAVLYSYDTEPPTARNFAGEGIRNYSRSPNSYCFEIRTSIKAHASQNDEVLSQGSNMVDKLDDYVVEKKMPHIVSENACADKNKYCKLACSQAKSLECERECGGQKGEYYRWGEEKHMNEWDYWDDLRKDGFWAGDSTNRDRCEMSMFKFKFGRKYLCIQRNI